MKSILILLLAVTLVWGSEMDAAWEDASLLQFQEAHARFAAVRATIPSEKRQADYGFALTLLNLQPKTAANIESAREVLVKLRTESPSDLIGIASLYYLARIEQVHRSTPNLPLARELYGQLIREYPSDLFAQRAIIKLAVLDLTANVSTSKKRQVLHELDKQMSLLTDPALRCNFDLVVSIACVNYGLDDERALRYMIEADALGIPIEYQRAFNLVRMGNLASKLGRKDLAVTSFERFLRDYPRHPVAYSAQKKLEKLREGGKP